MSVELIETTLPNLDARSPLIERLAAAVIRHEQALPGARIPDHGIRVTVFLSSNGTALTAIEGDDDVDTWDPPGLTEDVETAVRAAGIRVPGSARIALRVRAANAHERMAAMRP